MLTIDARREIEKIDEELQRLYIRRAELQLYVEQMDAYVSQIFEQSANQMRDWWANYQKEKA